METDEDRTSEDEADADAEDEDEDGKQEEVDAAGKDALSSLLSLGGNSECDVDITGSLVDDDDADSDNKDDANDARGATSRARTSSSSLSSTATETATATAAAFPCATASSRGLMHPPAARPRPPLASLPRSLVASSSPSMPVHKQRRSLPLFITDSTRASSGPLSASASSRSTDASASSTGMPVSLFLGHLSITLLVFSHSETPAVGLSVVSRYQGTKPPARPHAGTDSSTVYPKQVNLITRSVGAMSLAVDFAAVFDIMHAHCFPGWYVSAVCPFTVARKSLQRSGAIQIA